MITKIKTLENYIKLDWNQLNAFTKKAMQLTGLNLPSKSATSFWPCAIAITSGVIPSCTDYEIKTSILLNKDNFENNWDYVCIHTGLSI